MVVARALMLELCRRHRATTTAATITAATATPAAMKAKLPPTEDWPEEAAFAVELEPAAVPVLVPVPVPVPVLLPGVPAASTAPEPEPL